jgi:hypothetical protein
MSVPDPVEQLGCQSRRTRAVRGRGQPLEVTWHGPDGSGGH